MATANVYPVFYFETGDVGTAESYLSVVIVAVSQDIAAKSALARTTLCLYKVQSPFLEKYINVPDVSFPVGPPCKDLWNNGV